MGAPGGRFHNRRSHPNRRPPDLRATRVMRTAGAAIAAGMLLNPLTAHASPNPSPSLDRVLVVPQVSGYVEVDAGQGLLEGPFSAKDFAAASSQLSAVRIQAALQGDGFVAGYGRTWIDQPNQRALAELVIAFKGGAGAKKWMSSSEKSDKADQTYARGISVSGIDPYYGVHMTSPTQPSFVDIVGFVKGNDYFAIGTAAEVDDLGAAVTSQAKGQYDFAPQQTIPPSQWPENTSTLTEKVARLAPGLTIDGAFVALLAGVVLIGVGLVRRRGRRSITPALAADNTVHMSDDGHYWWDGLAWRNASEEAPPAALRSVDDYYWWDGRLWRPVPRPPSS
jgi:hypothetical protein